MIRIEGTACLIQGDSEEIFKDLTGIILSVHKTVEDKCGKEAADQFIVNAGRAAMDSQAIEIGASIDLSGGVELIVNDRRKLL